MVNKYIKALGLTVILTVLGILLIGFADDARLSQVSSVLEENAIAIESTQQLLFYESITGDTENVCNVLSKRIDLQAGKTNDFLMELEGVNAQTFFANTELAKMKFLNQNIQLYLLVQKSILDCGNEIKPILYFYTDKSFSADEAAQAKILNSVVKQCPNVRVFAFPHDLDIPVVDVLVSKHSTTRYPAIVVENEKIEGLSSEELIIGKVACKP
ncbi:MAG: hypothetical protein NUV57_01665 [archaeon]|nr:hypothetical protein [archaeon]